VLLWSLKENLFEKIFRDQRKEVEFASLNPEKERPCKITSLLKISFLGHNLHSMTEGGRKYNPPLFGRESAALVSIPVNSLSEGKKHSLTNRAAITPAGKE